MHDCLQGLADISQRGDVDQERLRLFESPERASTARITEQLTIWGRRARSTGASLARWADGPWLLHGCCMLYTRAAMPNVFLQGPYMQSARSQGPVELSSGVLLLSTLPPGCPITPAGSRAVSS